MINRLFTLFESLSVNKHTRTTNFVLRANFEEQINQYKSSAIESESFMNTKNKTLQFKKKIISGYCCKKKKKYLK